jgi:hypothetical protein
MAIRQEIEEIDAVALAEPVGHWPAGAEGEREDPLDLPIVHRDKLKLIGKDLGLPAFAVDFVPIGLPGSIAALSATSGRKAKATNALIGEKSATNRDDLQRLLRSPERDSNS